MENSVEFLQNVSQYYKTRHAIRVALAEFDSEVNYDLLSEQDKNLLYEMLKDPSFEIKMFEFFLIHAPDIALRHLAIYYLEGDVIGDKAKYQNNLDTLLDDVREILGEDKFEQILQKASLDVRQFYFVKRAVKEVYGAESDKDLPEWYWKP